MAKSQYFFINNSKKIFTIYLFYDYIKIVQKQGVEI